MNDGFKKIISGAAMLACCATSAAAAIWLDGRVATIQALDKITARISTLSAPVGVPRQFGTLEVTVERCAFHPPEEPPEGPPPSAGGPPSVGAAVCWLPALGSPTAPGGGPSSKPKKRSKPMGITVSP